MAYRLNYGFVPRTTAPDGDPLDVYIIDAEVPLGECGAEVIAIVRRRDDVEDKLVARVGHRRWSADEIAERTAFQEQWFDAFVEVKEVPGGLVHGYPTRTVADGMTVPLIVVSGLPASGKSSVALKLGRFLGLPVTDKDDILERLFPSSGEIGPDERSKLSRQADGMLQRRVEASPHGLVVSHWRRKELTGSSGTPTDWLDRYPDLVEVHCVCRPDVAATRFLQRTRHPFHGDELKKPDEVLSQFTDLHRLGPLGIGHLVTIHTEMPVDIERLGNQIEGEPPVETAIAHDSDR